jgi:hypothetical protein
MVNLMRMISLPSNNTIEIRIEINSGGGERIGTRRRVQKAPVRVPCRNGIVVEFLSTIRVMLLSMSPVKVDGFQGRCGRRGCGGSWAR